MTLTFLVRSKTGLIRWNIVNVDGLHRRYSCISVDDTHFRLSRSQEFFLSRNGGPTLLVPGSEGRRKPGASRVERGPGDDSARSPTLLKGREARRSRENGELESDSRWRSGSKFVGGERRCSGMNLEAPRCETVDPKKE